MLLAIQCLFSFCVFAVHCKQGMFALIGLNSISTFSFLVLLFGGYDKSQNCTHILYAYKSG